MPRRKKPESDVEQEGHGERRRLGLAQRRSVKTASPFRVTPIAMGELLPGRSYDNIGGLLKEVEGVDQ